MPEDESLKSLLERLCSLEEQQLAKLSAILERQVAAHERIDKLQDKWQSWISASEENQKKARAYARGQSFGAWLRTAMTLFMLGMIALAIIIAHYLK